jgi:NAD(P)-dependent dehydrogenase (short-subunit alcohol dehydrogenase family)
MSRTALVTGGTGGLGASVTGTLLAAGWRVVVPRRSHGGPNPLPAHQALELVEADLFDQESVRRCVDVATGDPARPLRAVVNLVGGFAMGGRVHETPVEDFEAQLRINLRPAYLVCQAAIPSLVAAGGGAVICVSSQSVRRPFAGAAGYLTAKTAVLGLVGALDAEYARDGVRVNAILPGVIDTPGNRASQPGADRTNWTPAERIAETVAFLCGDASAAIHGGRVPV